jgi:hypothetical protein
MGFSLVEWGNVGAMGEVLYNVRFEPRFMAISAVLRLPAALVETTS